MRHSQQEKLEIIRIVEDSHIGVKRTLDELGINRSTFYKWYQRYQVEGYDGLANRYRPPRQFWNSIPPWEKEKVVKTALKNPDKSPRELAWHITDTRGYYISESSVYRILKANDLITSPAYTVITAKDKFENPTYRVNELWQTDFTYFKIIHWGWYYLSTVIDDFSRYILAWRLCKTMKTEDVKQTIDEAISVSGVEQPRIYHRPRLLSDNGSCYISKELKEYLSKKKMKHSRGKPRHPMTQGKIERYHRSLKNIILLDNYYSPEDLEIRIAEFVGHYNNYRYHESLNNCTPADVYLGRNEIVLNKRKKIKEKTLKLRYQQNMVANVL
jgi:transposase InsO family protein